jgi:DNA-binding FadR family transcriptional regulator
VAGFFDTAVGELGEPSLWQQRDVGGDVYVAAFAGVSRDSVGHEGRSGSSLSDGSQPDHRSWLAVFLHGFQPWQMFEARILLESGLAALAAERGTKEHHVALAEEVAEMFALVDCPSDYLFHDVLFHRIISQACGNPILAALMETVTSSMYEARRKTVIDMRESAEMHRQIFRAIRAREPVDARRLMEQHLQLAQAAQGDGASRRGCPMRIRPAARTNHSHLFRMSHFDFNKAAAAIREKGVFN